METLKELREREGLTQMQVAIEMGTSLSTIRNWETCRSVPTLPPQQLKKLLQLFNCSFDDFVEAVAETQRQGMQGMGLKA